MHNRTSLFNNTTSCITFPEVNGLTTSEDSNQESDREAKLNELIAKLDIALLQANEQIAKLEIALLKANEVITKLETPLVTPIVVDTYCPDHEHINNVYASMSNHSSYESFQDREERERSERIKALRDEEYRVACERQQWLKSRYQ